MAKSHTELRCPFCSFRFTSSRLCPPISHLPLPLTLTHMHAGPVIVYLLPVTTGLSSLCLSIPVITSISLFLTLPFVVYPLTVITAF